MTGNLYPTPTSGLGRALVGLITAALVLVLGAGAASAQEDPYNPDPPQISLSDAEVCEGDSIVVTVSDVEPGAGITVAFAGQTASLTAGGDGTASTSFGTESIAPGTYTAQASTDAGSASAAFTVLDDEVCNPSPPPSLSIADPTVCRGEDAVATVTGTPGDSVTITFAGQTSTVTLGSGGTASASFPTSGLAPGEYSFVATSDGTSASAPLVVLSPDAEECAPDTPNETPLSVSAADTCAHDPVVVSVTGADGGDTVTISLGGNTASVTAGTDGSAQTSIPTDGLSVAVYDVLATSGGGAGASTQVRLLGSADGCTDVLEQGSPRPQTPSANVEGDSPIAFTGAYTWPLVGAGVLLISIGIVLARRSRHARAS